MLPAFAVLAICSAIAETFPWRVLYRDQHRDEINRTIAQRLFGWTPDLRCDGHVASHGYCERCGQEGLATSRREPDHAVEPLKFCTSLDAGLRLIQKLGVMNATVRLTPLGYRKVPEAAPSRRFFYTITYQPHWVPWAHGIGNTQTEAVVNATVKFIEETDGIVALNIEFFRTRLTEFRERVRTLETLAKSGTNENRWSDASLAGMMLDDDSANGLRARLREFDGLVYQLGIESRHVEPLKDRLEKYSRASDLHGSISDDLRDE